MKGREECRKEEVWQEWAVLRDRGGGHKVTSSQVHMGLHVGKEGVIGNVLGEGKG